MISFLKKYFIIFMFSYNFLLSLDRNFDQITDETYQVNKQKIIEYIQKYDSFRTVLIEDFEDENFELTTHGDDDLDPDDWYLSTFVQDTNSTKSLVLYGNTWKDQIVDFIQVNQGTVWQIDMYSALSGDSFGTEIQAFGVEDTLGNRMYYSIWGTQNLDNEFFENYYQGYYSHSDWTKIIMPIGLDWLNKFQYEPVIHKLFYVNDDDFGLPDSIYFDNLVDITTNLPVAPEVEIEFEIITQNEDYNQNNRLSQTYAFSALVNDVDTELEDLTFHWDFGDGNYGNDQNLEHTYVIQDDHLYTVLLIVEDQDGLIGYASESIDIDSGITNFPLKLNFVGDIMMGRRYNCVNAPVEENCNEGIIPDCGAEYIFEYIRPFLSDSNHISVGNLETPIIDSPSSPHPTKSIIFHSSSETMSALDYSGIDVLSLANNHTLDYMVEGLTQTQSYLDTFQIKYFGAGINELDAMKATFVNHFGVNISFIGSSNVDGRENNEQPYLDAGYEKPGFYMSSEENLVRQLEHIENISDYVILSTHSGSEYSESPRILNEEDEDYDPFYTRPSRENREFRQFAIDQGVDMVINHHPHVLQGLELYNGNLIAHSLGNFVFDQRYPETWPSIILNTEINNNGFSRHWIKPVYIHNYIPKLATGKLARRLLDYLAFKSRELNTILLIDYESETADVFIGQDFYQTDIFYEIQGQLNPDQMYISDVISFERIGSIKKIDFLTENDFEYRLGREIIWNGDFEYNPANNCWDPGINYWRLIPSESEFINDSIFHEGYNSLQQVRAFDDLSDAVTEISYCVPFLSDYNHTVRAFSKGENTNNARINIQYYSDRNCNNIVGNESFMNNISGDYDWMRFEKNLEPNNNANFVDLIIRSSVPEEGVSNVFFDDISIVQWDEWISSDDLDSLMYPNDYYFLQVKSDETTDFTVKVSETIYDNLNPLILDFYASQNSLCVLDSVKFFNNSTGVTPWLRWEIENQEISYDENPIFFFDSVGQFDAKLSTYDYQGEIVYLYMDDFINVSSCFLGDINMDEEINVLDILLMVNLVLMSEFSSSADINVDEEVNILDVLLVVSIILND